MKIAMVLVVMTGSASAATSPPTDAELVARVDALAAAALADGPAAGFSVEIVRHRRVVVRKGYGQASVELAVPARPTTVYRIGSLTKQFTAAAIMKLVEQGRVHLDDELARWVPELPLHGKRVTVEQLLTHTSGIKDYTELPAFDRQSALENTHEEVLAFLRDQPFDFAPGEHFRYDNSGYFLLGLVIERASHEPYGQFVEEALLRPIGLPHTRYCDNAPIITGRAAGYALWDEQLANAAPLGMAAPFAGGGMCSTVDDLATWAQALAGGRVVSATSYAKMTTAVRPKDGWREGPYGFGLRLRPLYGHTAVHHTGHINGFAAFLATLPDDELTVAVLGNTEGRGVDGLADRILRVALGVPLETTADLPADAARYVGIYESPAFRVEVFVARGRLVSRELDKPHAVRRLLHQGGDRFVLGGGIGDERVQFHVVDGRAATFTFTAPGGVSIEGKRVR